MRKNQKYTQEEMYQAVEYCRNEGLSHRKYCKQYGIPYTTFKYWTGKYNKEKAGKDKAQDKSFIPVTIPPTLNMEPLPAEPVNITITYPNGTKVCCPLTINEQQLRILITLTPCSPSRPATDSISIASPPICAKASTVFQV